MKSYPFGDIYSTLIDLTALQEMLIEGEEGEKGHPPTHSTTESESTVQWVTHTQLEDTFVYLFFKGKAVGRE